MHWTRRDLLTGCGALALTGTGAMIGGAFAAEAGQDWPCWRGPTGNGVAPVGASPPVEWSASRNIRWHSPLPGRGHSSPIVVGDRIYLTTADEHRQTQSVVCLERATGKGVWARQVSQGGLPERIHAKNTHATPTLAFDGDSLFAVFCHHDRVELTKLSPAGEITWQINTGPYQPQAYRYGYAPSPLLYQDLVIVASEFEQGYLAAFARRDGAARWTTARPQVSYSSPIVAHVAGRDQLLISGMDVVRSYNPANGTPLWSAPGTSLATCGTMVWNDNIVFASGGYPKAETIAIYADGTGRVAWRNKVKCYEQSMLYHGGHVYGVDDGGVAHCWSAADGAERWASRLAGPVSASPVLADGRIYATVENGTTFVFRADPSQFQLLARNTLGEEGFATPTIVGRQLFVRAAGRGAGGRQEVLFCIEERAG